MHHIQWRHAHDWWALCSRTRRRRRRIANIRCIRWYSEAASKPPVFRKRRWRLWGVAQFERLHIHNAEEHSTLLKNIQEALIGIILKKRDTSSPKQMLSWIQMKPMKPAWDWNFIRKDNRWHINLYCILLILKDTYLILKSFVSLNYKFLCLASKHKINLQVIFSTVLLIYRLI